MTTAAREKHIQHIKEKADSYERSIQTIIAFDAAVRWSDATGGYIKDSYFLPGRRMTPEAHDRVDDITPDIIIQLSKDLGIVAELKITASTDKDFENAHAQLMKYDIPLKGWKTPDEMISNHDLSLLVDDLKRSAAQRYFENRSFGHSFSIVACARQSQEHEFYKIEKYVGKYSDEGIERKFATNPVAIPLEKPDVAKRISVVKFYDAEPPLEYTMSILWMHAFNELLSNAQVNHDKYLKVSCKYLTRDLVERYSFQCDDRRQPKRPLEAWIRQALNAFVDINYAKKDKENHDIYYVKYAYARKKSMIEVFAGKVYDQEKNKDSGNQLKLKL